MSEPDKPTGEEIYEFKKTHPEMSWPKVGEHFGENYEALRKRERIWRRNHNVLPLGDIRPSREMKDPTPAIVPKPTHKVKFQENGNRAELYSVSHRIKSLDQLLKACDADLSKWRVCRHTVNVWEMGRKKKVVDLTWNNGVMDGYVDDTGDWQLTDLWQVKAIFEPREEEPYEKALEALIEKAKVHAPRYDPRGFNYTPLEEGYLLVPNLYDAHFGKRTHRSINSTLKQAQDDFIKISEAVAFRAQAGIRLPDKILFPIGHDMLHVDSLLDKTSRGTWVETSVDVRNAIDAACEATATAAENFATVAPVEIIPIEGNHDRLQTYWLGKYLQAFFSNHPHVTVRNADLERQYFKWGRVGLGLTHDGNKPQELTTLFPIEARHMWPDIEWTEWLTGHMHHKRGALYAVDNIRATVVRTIPALCNMDNYHSLHLYGGVHRAADILYYHKENGPSGSFPIFVSEL